jgi:hypothetical protein
MPADADLPRLMPMLISYLSKAAVETRFPFHADDCLHFQSRDARGRLPAS